MSWCAIRSGIGSLLIAALAIVASAQERDRSKVPEKYKWNLADIYPDLGGLARGQREGRGGDAEDPRLSGQARRVRPRFWRTRSSWGPGSIRRSPASMCTRACWRIRIRAHPSRRECFRRCSSSPHRSARQTSYMEPEILKAGAATVEKFIASEPRLKVYTFYLKDIVRRAPHTLTDNEEKILADASPMAASASNIFGILSNADFPYPTVTLSDGKTVKLDQAGYQRAADFAEPRRPREGDVGFLQGAGKLQPHLWHDHECQRAEGDVLRQGPKISDHARGVARWDNIPVSVYTRLVDGVNKNLPSFHRYLKLRKRMMGVDQLHYYDLYAPLVGSVNLTYTPEEAREADPGGGRAAWPRLRFGGSARF